MSSINNVSIGDRFKTGKHGTAIVVDLREVRSLHTGLVTGYQCIAMGEGLATNTYEVPFSTVVRGRVTDTATLQELAEHYGWDAQ